MPYGPRNRRPSSTFFDADQRALQCIFQAIDFAYIVKAEHRCFEKIFLERWNEAEAKSQIAWNGKCVVKLHICCHLLSTNAIYLFRSGIVQYLENYIGLGNRRRKPTYFRMLELITLFIPKLMEKAETDEHITFQLEAANCYRQIAIAKRQQDIINHVNKSLDFSQELHRHMKALEQWDAINDAFYRTGLAFRVAHVMELTKRGPFRKPCYASMFDEFSLNSWHFYCLHSGLTHKRRRAENSNLVFTLL